LLIQHADEGDGCLASLSSNDDQYEIYSLHNIGTPGELFKSESTIATGTGTAAEGAILTPCHKGDTLEIIIYERALTTPEQCVWRAT